MKHSILLAMTCSVLLAGCAATTQDTASAQRSGPDETYVPTGSSIARRSVDRASPVKTASKEEFDNARLMGGDNLNPQRN